MWLYVCWMHVFEHQSDGRHKETFPLTFDLGLCAANQTLREFGVRGCAETTATALYPLCLRSLDPFHLFIGSIKTAEELFVLETQVKSLCFVLLYKIIISLHTEQVSVEY